MPRCEIEVNWPLEGVSVLIKSEEFKSSITILDQRSIFSFDESEKWTYENVDVLISGKILSDVEIRDCGEEAGCVDLIFPCGSIIGYVDKEECGEKIVNAEKKLDYKQLESDLVNFVYNELQQKGK